MLYVLLAAGSSSLGMYWLLAPLMYTHSPLSVVDQSACYKIFGLTYFEMLNFHKLIILT